MNRAAIAYWSGLLAATLLAWPAGATAVKRGVVSFKAYPPDVQLSSAEDRQSLVVQAALDDTTTRDVTHKSTLTVADPKVARLEGNVVIPVSDGETVIRIACGGQQTSLPVRVSNAAVRSPVSFKLDVMPVFLKAGCNSGGCHGSARGQDGFRLSLFGFDPDGDLYRITHEQNGRRINLAEPRQSLLVTKSLGEVTHTGGELFKENSAFCGILLNWLRAGVPADPTNLPVPVALEVMPNRIVLEGEGDAQQLVARVRYSDGSDRDVTSSAVFQSNNDSSAKVTPQGLIRANQRGEAFILARYATFAVGAQVVVVPRGVPFAFPNVPEANYVDTLVNRKLHKLRIAPSELCTDSEFIRRAYLDIVGQLPARTAVETFAASGATDKREKLVDELLGRKEFVELWVMKWAELLQIRSNNDFSYKSALLYYTWLQDRISRNVPLNQIVRELLSSAGGTFKTPPTNYYQVETDPLKVGENAAQVFLGMRLQCAQCHNHPFDRWTMNDYYGFAAFFAQIGRKKGEDPRETIVFNQGSGETKHPVTKANVPPQFLGGGPADCTNRDRREVLAEWLTSTNNAFFAQNTANIVWAHFLGRGIIDPVDDVRVSNPASNPELLEELGRHLVTYGYDFRRLVRDICTSRTYQLSTRTNPTNARDERNFSHAHPRRIRAEVLLDCISQVTETKNKFQGLPSGARAVQIADGTVSTYFLKTFGRASRDTVCSCEVVMQPNLSQALHLLNGETTQQKIKQGDLVKRAMNDQGSSEKVIVDLYWRCLARAPTDEEMKELRETLSGRASQEEALEDVFWALLNSKEFVFNH